MRADQGFRMKGFILLHIDPPVRGQLLETTVQSTVP
jgi:hypothetical protein